MIEYYYRKQISKIITFQSGKLADIVEKFHPKEATYRIFNDKNIGNQQHSSFFIDV